MSGAIASLGSIHVGACARNLRWLKFCFLVLTAVALTTRAGQTTNLPPVADAAMRDTEPDNNFGMVTPLPVGVSKTGDPINRALLKFDLSPLPTNAVITAATLRLVVSRSGTSPADFDLDRMLTDWSETSVTWNNRSAGTPWTAGGAEANVDYVSMGSATAVLNGAGSTNDFSSAGMISDVQSWLANPGANFGWILLAAGEPAGTGKEIASREDAVNPPLLIVQYGIPSPPPMPPEISQVSATGSEFHFSFPAESNRTYTVEHLGILGGTNWSVLTNIPAQSAASLIPITDALAGSNRFYRVRTP